MIHSFCIYIQVRYQQNFSCSFQQHSKRVDYVTGTGLSFTRNIWRKVTFLFWHLLEIKTSFVLLKLYMVKYHFNYTWIGFLALFYLFACSCFVFVRQHGVETVKMIPKHSASFKVFGEPRGPHYAHYDIVGGRLVRCDLKYFMLVIHWPLNFILFQLDWTWTFVVIMSFI